MCCFSKPVVSVSATNIFARAGEGNRQFLVYSMSIEADQDLAMILPLPVIAGVGEKEVEFINLKDYPQYPGFFASLRAGFPQPLHTSHGFGLGLSAASADRAPLEVVQVGDFEASFVPTVADFARLDERFRLPTDTWNELPAYKSYGFAVFKLKPGTMPVRVHPMAFSFPRRDVKTLFFPTVHIHDGKVHAEAEFDHALYCQPREHQPLEVARWEESASHARSFVQVDQTKGVVLADQHCYKKEMHGSFSNRDTFIGVSA
jgi:hypothetical protein